MRDKKFGRVTQPPRGFRRSRATTFGQRTRQFLNWLERVCRMRKGLPEIGWGDFTVLPTGAAGMDDLLRRSMC